MPGKATATEMEKDDIDVKATFQSLTKPLKKSLFQTIELNRRIKLLDEMLLSIETAQR